MQLTKLVKGMTIQYILPSSHYPVNPGKLWHGRVTTTFSYGGDNIRVAQVELLEPGYEGYMELVHPSQVRGIEPDTHTTR